MSKVVCENVYAEDIFKWIYEHVLSSGGDGCSVLVCKNFLDTALNFKDWLLKQRSYRYPEETFESNRVTFGSGNESIIFCDDIDSELYYGDYIFIVNKDCRFIGYNHKTIIGMEIK